MREQMTNGNVDRYADAMEDLYAEITERNEPKVLVRVRSREMSRDMVGQLSNGRAINVYANE